MVVPSRENAADYVFRDGEVITMDDKYTIAEAIAIKNNKIYAVGSSMEMKDYIGHETTLIDLEGRSLLPGFIDAHVHLSIFGTNLIDVSCTGSGIQSLEQLFKILRLEAAKKEKGSWIRAWSFNENDIVEKRFPTRRELDEISTEHPILIVRVCNHLSIANSRALELADFHEGTENPEGGIIEKDDSGQLTGKLIENAHMRLSEIASLCKPELKKATKAASDTFIENGITSIHDAGGYGDGERLLEIMREGAESGDIKVRMYAMIGSLTDSEKFIDAMKEKNIVTGFGDEKFRIGPVKLFVDGSSTGPTLATRKPYTSNPNEYGILYFTQDNLNEILIDAHKRGYQITAHAQGDRAIEMVLNCIEDALSELPRSNHRHRIEHAGIAAPDLQKRMKHLNVIAIPNPAFIFENGDAYINFYGDRIDWMYPARDYAALSVPAAFGSDAPIVGSSPLLGIHAAVNRRTKNGQLAGKRQRIEILQAIKAYTAMGAFASFEEQVKGSLEAGKLADLVVLDRSILSVDKEEIKNLQVDLTMIDGEVLYCKHNETSLARKK